MSTTTFVLLIASVLSVQGNQATIDRGVSAGLRVGDSGAFFYELTLEQDQRKIDLGEGTVIEARAQQAVVEIPKDADTPVQVGHLMEFRIPVTPQDGEELLREARIEIAPKPRSPAAESHSVPGEAARDEVDSEIRDAINTWAQAWSEKRVDDYLASYAQSFRPPLGMSRDAWEAQRRERISKPTYITVRVNRLEIVSVADQAAVATFVQSYRSNTYRDEVPKLLDLIREDGHWKIREEKEVK